MSENQSPYPAYICPRVPWLGEMPDHWEVPSSVKVGYEISFTRYFYKPQPLRSLEDIRAEIAALEQGTEGLIAAIVESEISPYARRGV